MTTSADRLRAGYATALPKMAQRRREDLAAQYKPSDQMERIAAMSARAREALLASSTTLRIGYGIYSEQKAAHEALDQERTP